MSVRQDNILIENYDYLLFKKKYFRNSLIFRLKIMCLFVLCFVGLGIFRIWSNTKWNIILFFSIYNDLTWPAQRNRKKNTYENTHTIFHWNRSLQTSLPWKLVPRQCLPPPPTVCWRNQLSKAFNYCRLHTFLRPSSPFEANHPPTPGHFLSALRRQRQFHCSLAAKHDNSSLLLPRAQLFCRSSTHIIHSATDTKLVLFACVL